MMFRGKITVVVSGNEVENKKYRKDRKIQNERKFHSLQFGSMLLLRLRGNSNKEDEVLGMVIDLGAVAKADPQFQ